MTAAKGRHHIDHDMPTDPFMRVPLNTAPERYQDLIVPRVFVEPDEQMDALRTRSLRWAIRRDILAIGVMLLVAGLLLRPLWSFLANALL